MVARDERGNKLDILAVEREKVIGSAIETQIGESPTRKRGTPISLSQVFSASSDESVGPNGIESTTKGVRKAVLSYIVSDFKGGELHTGEVTIDIQPASALPEENLSP